MSLSTIDYLNLSALAYMDLSGNTNKTLNALIEGDVIKKIKIWINPNFSPFDSLSSYRLNCPFDIHDEKFCLEIICILPKLDIE